MVMLTDRNEFMVNKKRKKISFPQNKHASAKQESVFLKTG